MCCKRFLTRTLSKAHGRCVFFEPTTKKRTLIVLHFSPMGAVKVGWQTQAKLQHLPKHTPQLVSRRPPQHPSNKQQEKPLQETSTRCHSFGTCASATIGITFPISTKLCIYFGWESSRSNCSESRRASRHTPCAVLIGTASRTARVFTCPPETVNHDRLPKIDHYDRALPSVHNTIHANGNGLSGFFVFFFDAFIRLEGKTRKGKV